ncbi:unnamed protein product [Bodo saltans]|uniref:LisH domain-containing protein n=1 Tax=Bodo saltans TaxID=75058 RepID=A0A0S4KKJ0_BODSA|nr:unnamed protein product [Bodo saltans]|eukprot:CUI14977.1 unnamed protein product [Bodo saltans]
MSSVVRAVPASAINFLVYEYLREVHPVVATMFMAKETCSSQRAQEIFGKTSLQELLLASAAKVSSDSDMAEPTTNPATVATKASKKPVAADSGSDDEPLEKPVAAATKASPAPSVNESDRRIDLLGRANAAYIQATQSDPAAFDRISAAASKWVDEMRLKNKDSPDPALRDAHMMADKRAEWLLKELGQW